MPAWCLLAFAVTSQFVMGVDAESAPLSMAAGFQLIGHRGGVVSERSPENSYAALEEAIRRGYTHVEVDVQSTADGVPVCLHDRSLKRAAGADGIVDKLTLQEIRARAPVELVPDFDSYCARSDGRIGVMVDVKYCPEPLVPEFAQRLRGILETHHLAANALFIGRRDLLPFLKKTGRVNWNEPPDALAAETDAAERFFVFRHAADLNAALVRAYQEHGLKVIVSINTHHYRRNEAQAMGARDVAAMLALGVDGLQIDSDYEQAVRDALAARASSASR